MRTTYRRDARAACTRRGSRTRNFGNSRPSPWYRARIRRYQGGKKANAGHQKPEIEGENPRLRSRAATTRRRFPLTVIVVARCGADAREDARVVRGSEGGLRHRPVGTLVTSAEPRVESLLTTESLGFHQVLLYSENGKHKRKRERRRERGDDRRESVGRESRARRRSERQGGTGGRPVVVEALLSASRRNDYKVCSFSRGSIAFARSLLLSDARTVLH